METQEFIKGFEKLLTMKKGRRKEFLKSVFSDDDFYTFLFNPKPSPVLGETVENFHSSVAHPKVIKWMADYVESKGIEKFNRNLATFFMTVSNIMAEANAGYVKQTREEDDNDIISNSEAEERMDKIEECNKRISRLMGIAKDIVKPKAKNLTQESRLPKYLCITALHTVPEPKFINKYKVGAHLNNLLSIIYSEVNLYGDFDRSPNWKAFFRIVFGNENVTEVATFILLEGVHRIDQYKNSNEVKRCWDSLTQFALRELENAPDNTRQHYMDLYVKRIDRMFQSNSYDLRVNLLKLSEEVFPKLVRTIEYYYEKIKDIIERGSKTRDNRNRDREREQEREKRKNRYDYEEKSSSQSNSYDDEDDDD
jgi:hypothetical protein